MMHALFTVRIYRCFKTMKDQIDVIELNVDIKRFNVDEAGNLSLATEA